jgi:NADPH:quinone reductase-like Zn-dependent oxidoreductase
MNTMKAAQIFSYGDPDVLRISTVDRPKPGPAEVLVAVRATSVNGHDDLVRSGAVKMVTGRRFPIGVGLDFVGEIVETGTGVSGFTAGELVWGMVHPRGRHVTAGAAEYVVVPADRVGPVPDGVPAIDAAALVVAGTTALQALRRATRLVPGEKVLVRGAAGGVGTAVVQLAHAAGAHVTALARRRQADVLTSWGADEVLDYTETTAAEIGPFDVVVDMVGTDLGSYRRRLAPGGRMVTVGLSGAALAAITASTIHGPRRIRAFSLNPHTAQLRELAEEVVAGALRPVVDAVYPLDDIASAHRAFARGGVVGKQVVTV